MSFTLGASKKCLFCNFREFEYRLRSLSLLNTSVRWRSGVGSRRRRENRRREGLTRSWSGVKSGQKNSQEVYSNLRRLGNFFRRDEESRNIKSPVQDYRSYENGKRPRTSITKSHWRNDDSTFNLFGDLVLNELYALEENLKIDESIDLAESWGISSHKDLNEKISDFHQKIVDSINLATDGIVSKKCNPLFYRLRQAFVTGSVNSLKLQVKFSFLSSIAPKNFSRDVQSKLAELANLCHPDEWYPSTRSLQRTVYLHVGPTNSGKTYHALQRLESVDNGVYAGPLRLLAHEVYSRFNAKGKLCGLVTGEEKRIPPELRSNMYSCTVEMIPLNVPLDVAVIDEIQMIASPDRGWAWTQAFLGVQAKEVHLCGELRTINIIKSLCALVGDKLVIHKYQRLSPLELDSECVKTDLSNLRKGDAVILFSRLAIHGMKQEIERVTGKRCAIVYGSLPPEIRAQQAALFNDPNNDYDFLVASDAVGMGLNLSIRRIIFETTQKFDGNERRVMETSEIKQIAGRAGRYKTGKSDVTDERKTLLSNDSTLEPSNDDKHDLKAKKSSPGLVTTLNRADFMTIKKCLSVEAPSITKVGISPPSDIVLRFASYFPPSTPFSYILLRLYEISSTVLPFTLCMPREEIAIADLIQPFDLSSRDRLTFTAAPISTNDPSMAKIIKELASCLSCQSGGKLLDLKSFKLELLDININDHPTGSKGYLREAESLHKALTLYLWLSYRFAGVFTSQALAFHIKSLLEAKIDECLARATYSPDRRKDKNSSLKSKEQAVLEAFLNSTDNEQVNLSTNFKIDSEKQDIPAFFDDDKPLTLNLQD
ncbi:ATP-dependent RNA helicase suv3, mitochondrial [Erysiphe neolycopersici]|uniref:ATP-dependent RNA helicase SUV3, mitochondrial n=1 Tax=Erysiphe neolycopersici TaxID=212602 RepID=A0A420HQS8_9PEZI|nr:ATP-dependent RNA helicase suv3, mitochondrial [Erysiphe neolycopersici]